jgi:nickel transport protein
MRGNLTILAILVLMAFSLPAHAHSINYRVENRGISTRIFFAGDEPMRYAAYEIFAPGDAIAYQKGRSDRNGVVSFLPDRPGKWLVKVTGEAAHGPHGTQFEVDVNAGLDMESFHKPLVAQYTKGFIGMSIVLFIFSLWALWRSSRKERQKFISQ